MTEITLQFSQLRVLLTAIREVKRGPPGGELGPVLGVVESPRPCAEAGRLRLHRCRHGSESAGEPKRNAAELHGCGHGIFFREIARTVVGANGLEMTGGLVDAVDPDKGPAEREAQVG